MHTGHNQTRSSSMAAEHDGSSSPSAIEALPGGDTGPLVGNSVERLAVRESSSGAGRGVSKSVPLQDRPPFGHDLTIPSSPGMKSIIVPKNQNGRGFRGLLIRTTSSFCSQFSVRKRVRPGTLLPSSRRYSLYQDSWNLNKYRFLRSIASTSLFLLAGTAEAMSFLFNRNNSPGLLLGLRNMLGVIAAALLSADT